MKYALIILFSITGLASFGQNSKQEIKPTTPIKGQTIKWDSDSLKTRYLDSLINLPPHPDSAFISLNMVNKIIQDIDEQWNGKNGKVATAAFQSLINYAAEEYRRKRAIQLKKQ